MFDKNCMRGKTALITGASSGLGAHFAAVLAEHGARVILTARRTEELARLEGRLGDAGSEVISLAMDVTKPDAVDTAFTGMVDAGFVPDVLVNNAGVADIRRFLNLEEEAWEKVLSTNLDGVYRVARAFAQLRVSEGGGGCILNMASIGGLRIGVGQTAYGASKAAVIHLTRGLSLELMSKNIRVNALCPGFFETEMNAEYFASPDGKAYLTTIPSKRLGNLSELDGPLLLLCSDAGSFVNGVALPVDGSHSNSFN